MKKLLFGAAIAMIVISPALAGHGLHPSWRSPMSSDAPPVYGKEFGAPVAGSPAPVCHLGFDPSQIVCSQPTQTPLRSTRRHEP